MRFDPPEPDGAVVRRRVEVDGPYGIVPGRLVTPAGNDAPSRLVLLGHGGGGGKDEGRFPQLAARFALGLDAAALVIDGPVHGERAPQIDDPIERFKAGRRALVDPEMPARFTKDWRASVDACRAEGIGSGPLLYAGFSMGTVLGVPAVAGLGEVAGAVFGVGGVPAQGGVANLIRNVAGDEAADLVEELDDAELRGRIMLDAAITITDTQVLMVNTTEDVVFPIDGALQLFRALPCPKRIAFWEGGHTELGSEAIGLAIDFLDRVASGAITDEGGMGAW